MSAQIRGLSAPSAGKFRLVRTLLEYPETNDNVVFCIRKTHQGFIVNDGGSLAKYVGIATTCRRCRF